MNQKIIEVCGIPLHSIGVDNWALSRQQALLTLNYFRAMEVPVLGGDVYVINDGEIEHTYDSWHFDRVENDEKSSDFVNHSIDHAKKYIMQYNIVDDRKIFFSLVCFQADDEVTNRLPY